MPPDADLRDYEPEQTDRGYNYPDDGRLFASAATGGNTSDTSDTTCNPQENGKDNLNLEALAGFFDGLHIFWDVAFGAYWTSAFWAGFRLIGHLSPAFWTFNERHVSS